MLRSLGSSCRRALARLPRAPRRAVVAVSLASAFAAASPLSRPEAKEALREAAGRVRDASPSGEGPPILVRDGDGGTTVEFEYRPTRPGEVLADIMNALDDRAEVELLPETAAGTFTEVRAASGLVVRAHSPPPGGGGGGGGATRLLFEKDGALTKRDVAAVERLYERAASRVAGDAAAELEALGARVYRPEGGAAAADWDDLAGYESVKRQVQDGLVGVLEHPDVLRRITEATRVKPPASSQPKAVLLEGPPGTGKTTLARIVGAKAGVPLVVVRAERLQSFLVGESEKNLARLFELVAELGPSVLFIDEIETVASARSAGFATSVDRHDAKQLSVLLRHVEGFEAQPSSVLLGATNRRDLVDPAMLSRFELTVNVPLPTAAEREGILALYAKQLPRPELAALAARAGGLSGRSLRDLCAQAERAWAARLVRGEVRGVEPDAETYRAACDEAVLSAGGPTGAARLTTAPPAAAPRR